MSTPIDEVQDKITQLTSVETNPKERINEITTSLNMELYRQIVTVEELKPADTGEK